MKKYNLIFKGYWRDCNQENVLEVSGVYLVYRCVYNADSKTVRLVELMYIGQADNVRMRIANHDKYDLFLSECEANETLCYSVAEVAKSDLNIVENALIYAQKPRLNGTNKDNYNYDAAEFHLEGRCKLMKHLNFKIE